MNFKKENYKEKNEKLLKKIERQKEKEEIIQKEFDFLIPDYVLSEIAESDERIDKNNICALINLAILNNRINKENANILKQQFVLKELTDAKSLQNRHNMV